MWSARNSFYGPRLEEHHLSSLSLTSVVQKPENWGLIEYRKPIGTIPDFFGESCRAEMRSIEMAKKVITVAIEALLLSSPAIN